MFTTLNNTVCLSKSLLVTLAKICILVLKTQSAALAPAMTCAEAARQAASRHEVARSPRAASRRAEAYAYTCMYIRVLRAATTVLRKVEAECFAGEKAETTCTK